MLMFTLVIPFDQFQFTLIHEPNIPWSYATVFFTASDFTSITSHIHNWVLVLPWLALFILSRVISPLFSSSISGTFWPGDFIFQCPIFLPFYTVHGSLKAIMLKWSPLPSPVSGIILWTNYRPWARGKERDICSWLLVSIVIFVQFCLTLCNPMQCSPQGYSVHEILQARILEWVAIPFSTWDSCIAGRFFTI